MVIYSKQNKKFSSLVALGTFQLLSSHHGKWQPYWTVQTENIAIRADRSTRQCCTRWLPFRNETHACTLLLVSFLFSTLKAVPWCLLWRKERTETVRKGGVIYRVVSMCLTLCDTMDCIVHGLLQARILEWAAYAFTRGSSQPRDC